MKQPINWPDLIFPPINLLNSPAKEISPCIGVCKIEDDECTGCGRTLDEIANWSTMTFEQKKRVTRRIRHQTKE